MKTFQFFRSFLRGQKWTIAVISILGVTSQVFSLGESYLYKVILDKYLTKIDQYTQQEFYRGVLILIAIWIMSALLSRISKNVQNFKAKVLANKTSLSLFERVYEHAINLALDFHETKKTGETLRQLSKARDDMELVIVAFFNQFTVQIISFVIVTTFYFIIQWQVAVVMLVYVPVFILVTKYFARNINRVQEVINTRMENIHGSAQQALDSVMVVQSFTAQMQETQNMRDNNALSHEALKVKTLAWQKLGFVQGTLINLARLSIIATGSYFVFLGQMSIGDVLLLSMWAFYIYQPMYDISDLYSTFKEGFNSIARVQKLLEIQPTISSPADGFIPAGVTGKVEIKDVHFAYANRTEILSGISFTASSGGKLAIVGPSGVGKSTITKLIARFYDVLSGSILVDGTDIRQWDLDALRKTIGLVLQDTFLFNDTIYNNIRYGRFDATEEEIIAAAQKADCHAFIMQLPKQYQTMVGDKGMKLSGGQRQRVSIARTILKDPKILILDEATSALDSESEVEVQSALNEVSKTRTTITIAHRLSTIMNSDEILFLEDGVIAERGTHAELIALGGHYERYVALQKEKERISP